MKKSLLLLIMMSLLVFACAKKEVPAEGTQTEEPQTEVQKVVSMNFTVQGEGQVAKGLIEAAALTVAGVTDVNWDMDKKTIKISGTDEVLWENVHGAIAGAGFDTTEMKASNEAYEALPEAAKYRPEITERKATLKDKDTQKDPNKKGNRVKATREKAE